MTYTVYKITNLVNGKIYVGAHQTDSLDDAYMGSGRLIQRAHKNKQKMLKSSIQN